MTLTIARPVSTGAPLDRIAEECEVRADDAFRCGAIDVRRPADAAAGAAPWLPRALATALYRHYYLGIPDAAPAAPDRRPVFAREDPSLGRRLRAANASVAHWEEGWEVVAGGPEGFLVSRQGLRLHVTEDEVRPARPAIGAPVAVRFPADRPYASPGFYLTVSSRGPVAPAEGLARWYVAVTAEGAPALFGAVTWSLDALGVRFVAKVLNDPASYPRPDAGVVYVRRCDVGRVAPALLGIAAEHAGALDNRVPSFTRRLRRGLAIADDPSSTGRPMSFGQHRCGVIARGLVAAGAESTADARRLAILDAIRAESLDPDRLHLNPHTPEFAIEEASQ